ncbi:MAG TPA: endopeptidase La [Gemmatimonadaceae bacterium]|nr:endopeptidase La [Gemmatimonadaceae bacterium]
MKRRSDGASGRAGSGARKKSRAAAPPTPAPTLPIPLLALRSTVLMPGQTVAVQMGADRNVALARTVTVPGAEVVVTLAAADRDAATDGLAALTGRIGVLCRARERSEPSVHTVQLTLHAVRRVRIGEVHNGGLFPHALVEEVTERGGDEVTVYGLSSRILTALDELLAAGVTIDSSVQPLLRAQEDDPPRLADLACAHLGFRVEDRDEVLQRLDVVDRLRFVASRIEKEVARAQVAADVARNARTRVEGHQREFFLRQQLRAIQAELGEGEGGDRDSVELAKRIDEAELPDAVAREARREAERLRALPAASSEHQVLRTYLDWVIAIPWSKASGHNGIALDVVEKALDERHWGLREAKERILEHLAVRQLRGGEPSGPILCFVGPPGTGKTSLGEAIARAMGRAFDRFSVGGVRDEAEIRGHRRTYVGAMPGRIAQALRRATVRDPVLMIDEIDKMSAGGATGDPTAAMLEVLDPAHNHAFADHYLNLPLDLSGVLFLCTANNLFDIPDPLRDRLEVIRIAGYTAEEKVEIAWRYSLPKLFEAHGLSDIDLQFTDEVLAYLAGRYAREAGLRNFERQLARLMRKRARRKAEGDVGAWVMDATRVEELLGPPPHPAPDGEMAPSVGTVTGLAWTADGGELMTIEALLIPGRGQLIVTGQLGDVMRESVDAALSYVRSRASEIGIDDAEFRRSDLHVHFPAGAVPKDGPSAGVAVTLAIASALSRRPVRRDIAMTGEVTLRGRILEVGGTKEKVLAAYRAGLREVLLPALNAQQDLRDLPREVAQRVAFRGVRTMDDVLVRALLPATDHAAVIIDADRGDESVVSPRA